MGLLDDAIREHLELKRSRGADQAEVERLEREALGAGEKPAAAVEAGRPEPEPESAAEPELPREPESAAEPEPPREPESASEPEPEPALEPAPELSQPVPAPAAQHVDQPTRQFTLEELEEAERREDEADSEHDELEETPDFLQETPEHDRLWFEQKPPKDFDF